MTSCKVDEQQMKVIKRYSKTLFSFATCPPCNLAPRHALPQRQRTSTGSQLRKDQSHLKQKMAMNNTNAMHINRFFFHCQYTDFQTDLTLKVIYRAVLMSKADKER